jgi:hypothetical protein
VRVKRIVLVLSIAALAAACSPGPSSFDSLDELAAAIDGAGIPCEGVRASGDAQLVSSAGTCIGSGLRLYLFDDPADLDRWAVVAAGLGPMGIGPNWAVTGDYDAVERVNDDLGARPAGAR